MNKLLDECQIVTTDVTWNYLAAAVSDFRFCVSFFFSESHAPSDKNRLKISARVRPEKPARFQIIVFWHVRQREIRKLVTVTTRAFQCRLPINNSSFFLYAATLNGFKPVTLYNRDKRSENYAYMMGTYNAWSFWKLQKPLGKDILNNLIWYRYTVRSSLRHLNGMYRCLDWV